MSRADKIASIIEKRRPLAQKIERVENNVRGLEANLRYLENHKNQLINKIEDGSVTSLLKEINFDRIYLSIYTELEALKNLRLRFSRNTLNIGVVGLMRQGKSTLLQNLSGLGNDIIPARSKGACTAVRSTIYHREQGEPQAQISFHTEDSLCKNVIVPYYKYLDITPIPNSFNEFINSPFEYKIPGDATKQAIYERLKNEYYLKQTAYINLLGCSDRIVDKTEIQEYVAHPEDPSNINGYKNLAVKEVKIYCSFPNKEVGQIALVDIPGLGDLKLGDEDLMLETLGKEVDIVLFIRRPDPIGDDWKKYDTDLYDQSAKALNDLDKRSFMVLNKLVEPNGNESICKIFQEKLIQGNVGLNVVECMIVNCRDTKQANQVLDRVLDYLESKITDIDTRYAESCQKKVLEIQEAVEIELNKINNIFGETASLDNQEYPVFVTLFDQFWKNVTTALQNLLENLRKSRHEEDINFQEKIQEILKNCQHNTGLPSLKDIKIEASGQGGYQNAYYYYLNIVRAHLSQQFLCLDESLKTSLNLVKCQIAEIFIQEGNLGELTELRGEQFLYAIAEEIPEKLISNQPSKLKFAFQLIAEFTLSYRGLIQHRIRQHLDILTPNNNEVIPIYSSKGDKEKLANQIFINLEQGYKEAIYKCQNALEELLREPNQASFAIVEEFIDRVFRVKDGKKEWDIFLYQRRSKIWPSEFKHLEEQKQVQQKWLETVEKLTAANQLDSLLFLN